MDGRIDKLIPVYPPKHLFCGGSVRSNKICQRPMRAWAPYLQLFTSKLNFMVKKKEPNNLTDQVTFVIIKT